MSPTHHLHYTSTNDDHPVTMREYLQELTAPPAQTLQTLQPTSTTASYTVSTRPVPRTISARLFRYISILLRVAVLLATLFLLWAKWRVSNEKLLYVERQIMEVLKEWQMDTVVEACQWRYIVPGALVTLFLVFRRNYTGTSPLHEVLPQLLILQQKSL